jgi:HlyD family secretion protein
MKPAPASQPSDLASLVRAGATGMHPRRKLYLALAGCVALLAVAYGCARHAKTVSQTPTYKTAAVTRGDIALTITATGNLKPTNEVTVGSELSGTTLEVFVDTNDRVTKGQPLARLDTRKLEQQIRNNRASVEAAKASVSQAEATLAEAEASLARKQELQRISNGKMPSQADMDTALATAARARATLASATASVGQAEAVVAMNESDLAKAIIRSPIDGIVLTRSIEPGQTVAASFTAPELFVIAESLEQMKLEVAIAEADIGRVAAGQSATFTVDAWAGRTYSAKVNKVAFGSATTNNVVTYETELEVANTDLSLRPGMTATADIHVAESKNVTTVPAAALRYAPATPAAQAPSKSFVQSLMPGPPRLGGNNRPTAEALPVGTGRVWVLENGQPRPVEVKTGLSDGRRTEISGAGIAEGLAVVTSSAVPTP